MIIRLTHFRLNTPVWVNTDYIVWFEQCEDIFTSVDDEEPKKATMIYLNHPENHYVCVDEAPYKIVELIRGVK